MYIYRYIDIDIDIDRLYMYAKVPRKQCKGVHTYIFASHMS